VAVETEKQDARKNYKKTNGYHPNFAFIGRLPVHIENHNGNTPAKYKQSETLERCFNNLDANGVKTGHFRADSASYQQSVVELVTTDRPKENHLYLTFSFIGFAKQERKKQHRYINRLSHSLTHKGPLSTKI
jgi:hypothetical protein